MSGYRYVNFDELCRLCTANSESKVNIFSAEGRRRHLATKIYDCLSFMVSVWKLNWVHKILTSKDVQINDKDPLPKVICDQCHENLESFSQFRNVSRNSQAMLKGFYRSSAPLNNENFINQIKAAPSKHAVLEDAGLEVSMFSLYKGK